MIELNLQYYAVFREQAGRHQETWTTDATTPGDLYAELRGRYPFALAQEQLKVAINGEFGDWSTRLRNGDTIVFIPPVAGG
jgi:molybdopterin converting factor small subunit